MKNNNRNIFIGAGAGAALLLIILIAYLCRFVRYMGEMPYLWEPSFNQTLHSYAKSRPSRYILALTGGYHSGKSTAMNLLAEANKKKNIFPIVVDFSLANNLQDCINLFKLQLLTTFAKGTNKLDNSDLKALSELHLYDYLADKSSETLTNPAFRIPFSAITHAAESILSGGFNEYGVDRLLQVLSYYEPIFHFSIYIHNYDRIYDFENGIRITNSALAYLSNSNQYIFNIPIIVEIKNSLRRFEISKSVRYITTPNIEKLSYKFVQMRIFRKNEYNTILNTIGPNPGAFEYIFRSIKYGQTFEEALNATKTQLDSYINQVADPKLMKEQLTYFCKNKDKIVSNINDLATISSLFKNELLIINNDMKIESGLHYSAKRLCK
ncbi:hypothetical protein TVAG_104520 [Trichomonas vaginalis G3]|uniref:Uncharacterized protein n=1 Tax=Trichomonas vaginalis (strain ATCC PRA-98 / G3) TaxID=412133 RepID=A2F6A0_TRIV3|nr:hypothetical protein TVAGG3_1003450 [Trichomonas vaginalis G3]EAX99571.1 hypothetical protein TVAG_104520 [Trichomonas vaginalis G3]KAI5490957.1 hypothetical protein TVAGG3_1003450 [Trichomonas vaginalis G3]|eukprot:XP_001312501.1 hypothetical protein [Trichomonas vaginalis G3]